MLHPILSHFHVEQSKTQKIKKSMEFAISVCTDIQNNQRNDKASYCNADCKYSWSAASSLSQWHPARLCQPVQWLLRVSRRFIKYLYICISGNLAHNGKDQRWPKKQTNVRWTLRSGLTVFQKLTMAALASLSQAWELRDALCATLRLVDSVYVHILDIISTWFQWLDRNNSAGRTIKQLESKNI